MTSGIEPERSVFDDSPVLHCKKRKPPLRKRFMRNPSETSDNSSVFRFGTSFSRLQKDY
jgi:hypothetical protein